jgi:hypothetical protein
MPGENVHLTCVFLAGTSAGPNLPFSLWDANWNPRILQSYERLILDDLQGNLTTAGVGTIDPVVQVSNLLVWPIQPTKPTFKTAAGETIFFKEGLSLPVGALPQVVDLNGGIQLICKMTGNGRIVEGTTQGVRPNWEQLLTAGGNF